MKRKKRVFYKNRDKKDNRNGYEFVDVDKSEISILQWMVASNGSIVAVCVVENTGAIAILDPGQIVSEIVEVEISRYQEL